MNKEDLISYLEDYVAHVTEDEKASHTISKYRRDIQKFIEYIPDNSDITKKSLVDFKDFLIKIPMKSTSVNSYITELNTFFKYTGHEEFRVKRIRIQQKSSITTIVNDTDYRRLLRYAKKRGRDDIYMIFKILYSTGVRGKELEAFTAENVQKLNFKVYNKGKERDIILTQDLARELRKYCKAHGIESGKMFPISYMTIHRQMKRTASAARVSLEKVYPHSFRHLFAKNFMDVYSNQLTELSDILGHSSVETTRGYTTSTIEEKRHKIEDVNRKKRKKNEL